MKEAKFNKKVQELWENLGGYIIKTVVSNKSGTHDMLACMPDSDGIGRFCSLEGKRGKNGMSPLQVAHRNKVISAGGLAKEIKTLDDVLQVCNWVKAGYIQKIEDEKKQLDSFNL